MIQMVKTYLPFIEINMFTKARQFSLYPLTYPPIYA
jgi:hypothetical protein